MVPFTPTKLGEVKEFLGEVRKNPHYILDDQLDFFGEFLRDFICKAVCVVVICGTVLGLAHPLVGRLGDTWTALSFKAKCLLLHRPCALGVRGTFGRFVTRGHM